MVAVKIVELLRTLLPDVAVPVRMILIVPVDMFFAV